MLTPTHSFLVSLVVSSATSVAAGGDVCQVPALQELQQLVRGALGSSDEELVGRVARSLWDSGLDCTILQQARRSGEWVRGQ